MNHDPERAPEIDLSEQGYTLDGLVWHKIVGPAIIRVSEHNKPVFDALFYYRLWIGGLGLPPERQPLVDVRGIRAPVSNFVAALGRIEQGFGDFPALFSLGGSH